MQKGITHADIVRLAELARMELSSEELSALENDLGSILTYVSELSTLTDVEGIDRTYNANTLRADEHPEESGAHTDTLLAEVPHTDRGYVTVKQIITKRDDN